MSGGQAPIFVMSTFIPHLSSFQRQSYECFWLDAAPERQSGRKAQISNITAAKVCLFLNISFNIPVK